MNMSVTLAFINPEEDSIDKKIKLSYDEVLKDTVVTLTADSMLRLFEIFVEKFNSDDISDQWFAYILDDNDKTVIKKYAKLFKTRLKAL